MLTHKILTRKKIVIHNVDFLRPVSLVSRNIDRLSVSIKCLISESEQFASNRSRVHKK